MYGKWLFKEIKTGYGFCKVEIFRKNFTDTAIEIGALESNSLTLAMENLGNITDPIGKSVCSFSIIDTDQIDYDEFFTPDATAYMVVVSTKTKGGAYVTRWSGYVTPDFFAENLSYRTPISISARDNIGYLNDVDFDLDASTITVRGLIEAAFNRIAEDYPMSLSFVSQKQTAEGILAIDATISTMLLREGSWYEAIETVLHDLGLQMRWVDNNTIAVLDLSQIPEYYATQAFNFVDASGYREILPAWRELAQEQDYGLRENFFEGQINNANLRFVKEETLNLPLSMGGVTGNPVMKYYAPSNWGVAGSTLTINTDNYKYIGSYGQEPSGQGGRIYFTGVQKDAANLPQNYMSYRQPVYVSQRGKMSIAFNAFNSLLATNKISAETLQVYNPADRFMDFATGDSLQLGLKINVFLHVGTKTFILGDTWEEITGAETNSLYFTLDKVGQLGANGTTTPTEQEITIDVNTIPYNGELELRIYGFCIHEKTNLQEDAGLATYDWLKMVSYIDDVRYSYERELATGQGARTEIAPLHNVKESKSYKFGQVPVYAGGINAYAGGLYNASKNMESMVLFQRNTNATSYNLLELVGREVIHFNKKNYNKLSGTIRNLAKEPLMFNRLFVRNGKRYAPFAYSLDIISNQMEITTMQEVENYVTESFSEINSAVTTGGAIVSAGNNTVMQYFQDAGNTKRIYELTAATEEEKKDTWVMIDGTAFPEARKINVKDLEGLNEEQVEAYLTANAYAKESWVTNITKGLAQDIANRVLIEDFEKLEGSVTGIAGYFTNGSANNALKLGGQLPSYYATVDALNLVKNDVTAVSNRVQKFEDVIGIDANGDVYVKGTRNFYTAGGTIGMAGLGSGGSGGGTAGLGSVTVRVNGQDYITDASGIVTIPSYPTSLPASDVYSWAKAATKPSYTASEVGALSETGGTVTGDLTVESTLWVKNYLKIVAWPGYGEGTTDMWYNGTTATIHSGASHIELYGNRVLHSGNYSDYALPLSGGTISGRLTVTSNLYAPNLWLNAGDNVERILTAYSGLNYDLSYYDGATWERVLTSKNYSSYALPLSGGILSDYWSGGTQIRRKDSNNGYVNLAFSRSDGTIMGGLGFAGIDDPIFITSAGDAYISLIHSGNIGSQSVNYASSAGNADTLDGYHAVTSGPLGYTIPVIGGDGVMEIGAYLDMHHDNSTVNCDFSVRLSCPAVSGVNVILPSASGTLALLTSNVASATKLQTARTIWGQSFDGTGDVNGILSLNQYVSFYKDGEEKGYVGLASGGNDYIYLSGKTLIISGNSNLILNGYSDQGNVLIGTTTDNGYKLQVAGYITTTFGILGMSASTYNRWNITHGSNTLYFQSGLTDGSGTKGKVLISGINTHDLTSFGVNATVSTFNGNVLIGTTSDTGDKLRVYGSLRADGVITGTSAIKMSWSGASTCGLYPNDWITNDGVNNRLWLYNDNQLALYGSEIQLRNTTKVHGDLTVYRPGSFDENLSIQVRDIQVIYKGYDSDGYVHHDFFSNDTHIARFDGYSNNLTVYGNIYSSSWFRSFNATGWINDTYGGGIYMTDANYVRVYNGKSFWCDGDIIAGGTMAMAKLASSSDRKLKDNIAEVSAEQSMNIVRQLRPTTWNWKKDGKKSYGFIAQDVQPIIPEMVSSVNDTLRLEYNQLHAFEIGAIKHLDIKVETQEQKIERLENRVTELENELKQYRRNA